MSNFVSSEADIKKPVEVARSVVGDKTFEKVPTFSVSKHVDTVRITFAVVNGYSLIWILLTRL